MPFLVAATVVAAIAAWTDWRSGTIPNWLTLGALGFAMVARGIEGFGHGGWRGLLFATGWSSIGAVVCGLVPAVMFWLGGAGGGDVKLFAAIGALCQTILGLEVETYSFAAAVVVAPLQLIYQGKFFATMARSFAILVSPLRADGARAAIAPESMTWFRMGPAVLMGAATSVLLHGPWLR